MDARDPRLAHRAVAQLGRDRSPAAGALLRRVGVTIRVEPDPEVGLRVHGLTRATWAAVAEGLLQAHENGPRAWFDISAAQRAKIRRFVRDLPASERDCLYLAGADWASESTRRKYLPTSAGSASKVLVSLA